MDFQGKVALVIGGASGIGLAIAKQLLHEGANVTVCDVSSSGDAVVKDLQAEFPNRNVIFVQADVRNDAQFEAAFSSTRKKWNQLNLVVNSAGVCEEKDWNRTIDINVKGVIKGTELSWKYMGKHEGGDGGCLVNIASVVGFLSMHIFPAYVASKHAVVGYSRSVGEPYHLNRTGVRVITLCPARTDTPILQNYTLQTDDLQPDMQIVFDTYPSQKADNVAKALLHVVQNGDSGSVWVSEEENPAYQLAFPPYSDMRVTST